MDKLSTAFDLILGILLIVYIILWIVDKFHKESGKPNSSTIYIDVSGSTPTFYEEVKIVNTTAELVTEFTQCMETITQDKSKKVMFEISNSANGGYIMKTKFGSS